MKRTVQPQPNNLLATQAITISALMLPPIDGHAVEGAIER